MVHPQLDVDISKNYSKIPTHICSYLVARSLCEQGVFLLTDYDYVIIVYGVLRRNKIEYENNLSDNPEQDSD